MSLYVRVDEGHYQRTGEVRMVGIPKDVDAIMYEFLQDDAPNTGFAIHRPDWFYKLIEKIGGKKGKVVICLLKKKGADNKVEVRIKDLVEWTGASTKTVMDTIKLLRDNNMLKTRTCMMMVNPGIEHRGDRKREAVLMRLYSEFKTNQRDEECIEDQ